MMKIALDKKILGGFIACSVILFVVAIISYRNTQKFKDANQWVNHTHEVMYEFERIWASAVEAQVNVRGYVITGNEDYFLPFANAKTSLSDHIDNVRTLTRDNPKQQKKIDVLDNLVKEQLSFLDLCIEARKQDFEKSRALVTAGEGRKILNEIKTLISELNGLEEKLLEERKKTSESDALNFSFIFIALLVIIVSVFVAVYMIIITNLKALREAQRQTAEKNWTLAGTGELIKDMQGNKVNTDLAQIIISRLASYLDVPLGAIYIKEENKTSLRLMASYVLNKKGPANTLVMPGEGIVGQAALERKTIELHDIKPQYFSINTTFGNIRPGYILAFPFMFENNVVGVIELGSTKEFTVQQREYLQLIADSIAIAVTSAQARDEVRDLLEETQRQSEELEVQQEELRQANEELQAKTDLLEQSETELRMQQLELKQVNNELEEKADTLSEQKQKLENAKTEIEQKAREVEISSRYKSEFLANMSHELRTPLNSILILSQLLSENRNNRLGDKDVEFARNIYSSGTGLLNLINEILDLSKIESGKMELELEKVTVSNLVNTVSLMFGEVATTKSINLEVEIPDSFAKIVMTTDKQRVEQILRNLLSNAFKFTPSGGTVTIAVGRPPSSVSLRTANLQNTENILSIGVSDTGIGIPADKRDLIFQAFQQADGSTKRKYGGTGLGLSISRELSHALGGEIQVASEEGKGSTFTLFIPVDFDPTLSVSIDKQVEIKEDKTSLKSRPLPAPELQVESNANDDRLTVGENDRVILIVEDDEKFALVLLDFVRDRGYKGIIANQGRAGLSFARHYRPVAILLDMNLPVMEGEEVLRLMKNDPLLRHIPVQIISAYDNKKEGMRLGAFDHIRKPVSIQALRKSFERIENFTNKKLKKLLVIEDDEQQNQAIRELIGNGDVKSFSAYRGTDAFAMLEKESFDCIIVDLGLPDMSGFDLMEKIKANETLNKIPIVVYTGKDLNKDETARLGKLADTVVLKTANSHERLLDETILFLHRVEAKLPREKQIIIRRLHKTDEILKGKKILLVDDDMRNIYSLTNALEEEGVHCITAENGKIALETLKQDPSIDLVLMDIMMPEMDGYEATIEIRKMDEFKKLPIIALTAKAMKGDKEKCLAVGMSDYVSKPVDVFQLLSLLRVWLYK